MLDEGIKDTIPPGFVLHRKFQSQSDQEFTNLTWSPDGQTLALASITETTGMLQLWNVKTGTIQPQQQGTFNSCIAWSPDGNILASGSTSSILLWNTKTGERIIWKTNARANKSITWSKDSDILVSGAEDGTIRFWIIEEIEAFSKFEKNKSAAFEKNKEAKIALLISHLKVEDKNIDARKASLEIEREIEREFRREIEKAKEKATKKALLLELKECTHGINSLAWSPNRITLASGSDDHIIYLWNTETKKLIDTFTGHTGSVNSLAWSPDGKILASASSDKAIFIWDYQERKLTNIFKDHTDAVIHIAFSPDGNLLASKALDGSVYLWRIDTKELVNRINNSSLTYGEYSGLAFHPQFPFLALPCEKGSSIYIWELTSNLFTGYAYTTKYTNAKVALVGDQHMGKTCLGRALTNQPYKATESSYGSNIWRFDNDTIYLANRPKEIHEIFLWDLAGQPGSRLIHQLRMKDVSLALITFDKFSETDHSTGIYYWERALRSAKSSQSAVGPLLKSTLVATCIDKGERGSGDKRINRILHDLHFGKARYFETSAKEDIGIKELKEAIKKAIDWSTLPPVDLPLQFQDIMNFIFDQKGKGQQIDSLENLYSSFINHYTINQIEEKTLDQFKVCLDLLEEQGLIQQMSFCNYILLQPELIDYYILALLNTVADDPEELGKISEDEILEGNFFIPQVRRIKNKSQEKLLLSTAIEYLVSNEIALRVSTEGSAYLICPSQATQELQDTQILGEKFALFRFEGPTNTIFTTLIVHLSLSDIFRSKDLWKDAAAFTYALEDAEIATGTYAISLQEDRKGYGELTLYFAKDKRPNNKYKKIDMCDTFEDFVHNHLQEHALPDSIQQHYIIVCTNCKNHLIYGYKKNSNKTVLCHICNTEVAINDKAPQQEDLSQKSLADAMKSIIDRNREAELQDIRKRACFRKISQDQIDKNMYDVLLCYNEQDTLAIMKFSEQLKNRGCAPLLSTQNLHPNQQWQDEIKKQIESTQSAAFFWGKGGPSYWQLLQIDTLHHLSSMRNYPIISVVFEDAPDGLEIPPFLLEKTKVIDFRQQKHNPDAPWSQPSLASQPEKIVHMETVIDKITSESEEKDIEEYIETDNERRKIELKERNNYEHLFSGGHKTSSVEPIIQLLHLIFPEYLSFENTVDRFLTDTWKNRQSLEEGLKMLNNELDKDKISLNEPSHHTSKNKALKSDHEISQWNAPQQEEHKDSNNLSSPYMESVSKNQAAYTPERTKVFISYSQDDRRFFLEFEEHLKLAKRNRFIDYWDRSKLQPGANEPEEIDYALRSTKIAVLLVSISLLASDLYAEEISLLLNAADSGDVIVLPVLLGACNYEDTPLNKRHFVNDTSVPLNSSRISKAEREETWDQLVRTIIRMQSAPPSSTIPYTNIYTQPELSKAGNIISQQPVPKQQLSTPDTTEVQTSNVLIASLGDSPVVVSVAFDLIKEKKGIIDKVVVLHPKDKDIQRGYKLVRDALPKDVNVQNEKLDFEDADSWLHACYFLKSLYKLLDTAQAKGESVYLSLAGGRKSMAALMAWVVPFFPCIQGLYYVVDQNEDHFLSIEDLQELSFEDLKLAMHPGLKPDSLVDIPFEKGHQISEKSIKQLLKATDDELDDMQYVQMEEALLTQAVIQGEKLLDVQVTKQTAEKFKEICENNPANAVEIKKRLTLMTQASRLQIATGSDTYNFAKCPTPLQIFQDASTSTGLVFYIEQPDNTDSTNDALGTVVVCSIESRIDGKFRPLKKIAASPDFPVKPEYNINDLPFISLFTPPTDSILIVPLGEAPMIATQLYTLLKSQEKHTIREVFLVCPERSLKIENAARIVKNALQEHEDIPCNHIRISGLADILSSDDCKLYQMTLEAVIDEARQSAQKYQDCRIDLALSGGRKGMTAMTMFAAQKKGLHHVYHTLITDEVLNESIQEETTVRALKSLSKNERNDRLFLEEYKRKGLFTKFILFRIPVFPADEND